MGTERRRNLRHRLPHAFPFLLAIGTVAHLAAENPFEGISAANLTVPLLLALLAVFVAWAVTSLFVQERMRRSLIAAVAGVPPLMSGYLLGWLRNMPLEPALRGAVEVGLLIILVFAGVMIALRVDWTRETPQFLNAFAVLLLLFAVPGLYRSIPAKDGAAHETASAEIPGPRPDIYLIILDAYTGNESLSEVYGFTNDSIRHSLRDRGFAFPASPRSNYTTTFLSVGSMLNRRYLNDLAERTGPDFRDRSALYHLLEFNRTVEDLKDLGYEFIYVGSSYPPMTSNRLADVQYSTVPSREFERLWTRMTVLPAILAAICPITEGCYSSALHFGPESAAETEDRLAFLAAVIERPGPKFVYAHWLLPHGPFRFDADCRPSEPGWTTGSMKIEEDSVARRRYLEQLVCTNKKILEVVDAVRSEPGDSAVIILQADHGDGRFPGGRPSSLRAAEPDQVRERFDVFAAYSGPHGLGDSLAAQRTPVNLFRTLVRVLWEFDEPPLDERYYWSGRDEPLRLTLVPVDSF